MSVDSSSSSSSLNATPPCSSCNSTIDFFYLICHKSVASHVIYTIYTATNVLFLLPLYILILYMFHQRWRRTTSHTDFFTYHMVAVEMFGILGSLFYTFSMFTESVTLLMSGLFVSSILLPGQSLLHSLTCVERYLAVVHPVTYMHLREAGGVRMRNGSIVCVWLLCFGWMGLTHFYLPVFPFVPLIVLSSVSSLTVLFCCLSVFCVLTRPVAGKEGGEKERVSQSKQRAFHITAAILGVMLLRFVGLLFLSGFYDLPLPLEDLCTVMDLGFFLILPSSLVLPLLFLNKAGKLTCCRLGPKSG